jgi:ubiquinone/menaquinone biosynthesis C-methylase UbiE
MTKRSGWSARVVYLLVALAFTIAALAQEPPPKDKGQDAPKSTESAKPKATPKSKGRTARPSHGDSGKSYMGRPIADVMSYLGADWLIRPERVDEERPDDMLDALNLKPGMTVADVGAGVGYTSRLIAQRVGPSGTVLATDLQPQMIQMLTSNMREAGIKNVKPILCTATDCKLPEGKVDLAIMVDVYHECSHPEATLKGIRRALKPGGRLVLVEFRAEDPNVPIKPEHKMTLDQVRREIEPKGYTFKDSKEFLPWQHIIIFERGPDAAEKAKAEPPAAKKAA